MLEEQGWDDRRDLADLVGENRWPVGPEGRTPGPPGHGGEGSDGADGDAG
jgi:hypothetical protein